MQGNLQTIALAHAAGCQGGITFGDPLPGDLQSLNARSVIVRDYSLISFARDPLQGNLQTIALAHAPRCMSLFLFSVTPHPGKPGSECRKIKNLFRHSRNRSAMVCGERGIRTPGPVARTTVFKTAAIDHSAISPLTLPGCRPPKHRSPLRSRHQNSQRVQI